MIGLDTGRPAPRADRYSSAVLHDDPNLRVIAFHLQEGQAVPPHRASSTVAVTVLEGEGVFRGEGGESVLRAGGAAVYAPDELHSMESVGGTLRFLAFISPRPS